MSNTTATSGNIGQKEKSKGGLSVEELSLRDYFAAKALQEILAAEVIHLDDELGVKQRRLFARVAYLIADAMLEARNK